MVHFIILPAINIKCSTWEKVLTAQYNMHVTYYDINVMYSMSHLN